MRILKFMMVVIIAVITTPIYASELAVITNKNNPNQYSADMIKKIFLGKILKGPDGEYIIPINVTKKERTLFNKKILNLTNNQLKSYWAKVYFTRGIIMPQNINSFEIAKNLVAKNPNIISYLPYEMVDDSVKVVLTVKIN
ncbi:hypothetical protein RI845_06635 [Thalassotalea nanhaiensis]|uniref:Phosphate ABC transporter substrate-binding protein n=1 Tax=Thalassotalea nanhaiensis TaxID=3065648 RepID=A0ABY9TLU3_9GAMM|nr:hypothetical protein RI845_06635 [Colwelliaceae bacterium SQ345]